MEAPQAMAAQVAALKEQLAKEKATSRDNLKKVMKITQEKKALELRLEEQNAPAGGGSTSEPTLSTTRAVWYVHNFSTGTIEAMCHLTQSLTVCHCINAEVTAASMDLATSIPRESYPRSSCISRRHRRAFDCFSLRWI